jgi:hypothetical protein
MFSLFFDSSHRVLMARVAGTFTRKDLDGINAAAAEFVVKESLVRFLCDMSAVETVGFSLAEMVVRAQRVAVLPTEERVYVTADPFLLGLCELFAMYQRFAGNREPLVVQSLDEAYRALELADPDFQPVQQ